MTRRVPASGLAALASCLLLGSGLASAAEPAAGASRLLGDLVAVRGGKLVYEGASLCTLAAPGGAASKFQVHSHAEAPAAGAVSRDHFVALVSRIETEISFSMADSIPGITPSQVLDALECDQLAVPIGAVDLEITTTVTAEGLQVEIRNLRDGRTSRFSSTWKELHE